MRTVIAGAHGKIARELTRQLAAQGHEVTGLIRNADHAADLRQDGAEPVVLDLERSTAQEVADVLAGADAVVFAGVGRFLQISSMGADSVDGGARPDGMDDVFYAYLVAKRAAEVDLQARRSFHWTIVRPGGLTDDPGTGKVKLTSHTGRGTIPRADVASVLAELLAGGTGRAMILELISGDQPVNDAVASLP
jgi:nucleoside-diphosphate-sugar epimerase